jgi:ABC-type antimicrobial peptide transport system permease subunit
LFFALVALLLAAIGVCGVLYYSVIRRRREIGIRIALGSPPADVVRRIVAEIFSMVLVGSVIGLGLGLAAQRYIAVLLYDVTATDPMMLALPWLTMLVVAILAALPPVASAVRTDPVTTLRSE